MADKVYQLPYDDVIDKDIHEWLLSLPRSRKGELVRNALRFYIQSTQNGNVITLNPSPIYQQEEGTKTETSNHSKRRSTKLPSDGNF